MPNNKPMFVNNAKVVVESQVQALRNEVIRLRAQIKRLETLCAHACNSTALP
eukprot:m.144321 g.144321  ORF g.144321 m.144321 type:complete len:52 (+) comp24245_c0_seq2:977-1132(+)